MSPPASQQPPNPSSSLPGANTSPYAGMLNPLSAVALARPGAVQLGSFNPGQMFQHAQRSLFNPWSTGIAAAPPLHGLVQQPAVALARYSTGLASGLGRASRSWAAGTLAQRERVQRSFSSFLSSQPALFGLNWHTVGPLDIIAFSETEWVPNHAGTDLPNGQGKVAAPSSVSGRCHFPC